jgi:hypothetical protein
MFLEKAQAATDESDADNWRLFPAGFRDKNSASSMHHEQVIPQHTVVACFTSQSQFQLGGITGQQQLLVE